MFNKKLQEKCFSEGELKIDIKDVNNFAYFTIIISLSLIFLFILRLCFTQSSISIMGQESNSIFAYYFITLIFFTLSLIPLSVLKNFIIEIKDTIIINNDGIKKEGIDLNLNWLRTNKLYNIKWNEIKEIKITEIPARRGSHNIIILKDIKDNEIEIYFPAKVTRQDLMWAINFFSKKTIFSIDTINRLCEKKSNYTINSILTIIFFSILDIFILWLWIIVLA